MAGYSDTPLAKKLGLQEDIQACVLHAPNNYSQLLPKYYPRMTTTLDDKFEWLHAFYTEKNDLAKEFPALKKHLLPAGQLWISWPKKSSGVAADLDENSVRDMGLESGLVDVKVAAIDNTWSGLKFVYRLKDR